MATTLRSVLISLLLQTTTTVPAGSNPSTIDTETWVIAVVSAVLGAVIALLGDYVFRRRAERKRFRTLQSLLVLELITIEREAHERAQPRPELVIRSPLPTEAWHLAISSGQFERLRSRLSQLTTLYQAVDNANWMGAAVVQMQQISSLATVPEVAAVFEQEARRLATEPYAVVADLAQSLTASEWARQFHPAEET